jgi:hypothetical protein
LITAPPMQQYQDLKFNSFLNLSLHYMFRPNRPLSGALKFGVNFCAFHATAIGVFVLQCTYNIVPSTLLRSVLSFYEVQHCAFHATVIGAFILQRTALCLPRYCDRCFRFALF